MLPAAYISRPDAIQQLVVFNIYKAKEKKRISKKKSKTEQKRKDAVEIKDEEEEVNGYIRYYYHYYQINIRAGTYWKYVAKRVIKI